MHAKEAIQRTREVIRRQHKALAFFYKDVLGTPLHDVEAPPHATRPVHLRHAPILIQTRALLQAVGNVGGCPTNLVACLLHGCGLRVTDSLASMAR